MKLLREYVFIITALVLLFVGGFFFGSVWTDRALLHQKQSAAAADSDTGLSDQVELQDSSDFSISVLVAAAEALGLEGSKIRECIDTKETAPIIADHVVSANLAGINGTPTTVIMVNGIPVERIAGAFSVEKIQQVLDAYSNDALPSPNPILTEIPSVAKSDHIRGDKEARIVLIEYSDFQCPFCQQFHPTLLQILAMNDGQVAWVYRHYPLAAHPQAQQAAEAAECVAKYSDNETFWLYADKLFEI